MFAREGASQCGRGMVKQLRPKIHVFLSSYFQVSICGEERRRLTGIKRLGIYQHRGYVGRLRRSSRRSQAFGPTAPPDIQDSPLSGMAS